MTANIGKPTVTLLGISLLAVVVFSDPSGLPPDVPGLERAVLDYRRAILRGHVALAQKTYLNGAKSPDRERTTTIWFDGNRVRNDVRLRYKKDETFHREIQCRNCECADCYLNYTEFKEGNLPVALSLHKMSAESNPDAYMVIDPRLLGMVVDNSPGLAANRSRMDSFVGGPDRRQVTARGESWNGHESQVIDYTLPSGAAVRIWVVPEWGPSVGRIEINSDIKGRHYSEFVESGYRRVGPTGVWFPATCLWQQQVDGKLLEKETVDIQIESLGEPLPPDTFRLAGMDIPPGWPVSGFRNEGISTWNGKEIVPEAPPAVVRPLNPGRTAASANWPYVVGAIVFALLGVAVIWFYLSQRKPGSRAS